MDTSLLVLLTLSPQLRVHKKSVRIETRPKDPLYSFPPPPPPVQTKEKDVVPVALSDPNLTIDVGATPADEDCDVNHVQEGFDNQMVYIWKGPWKSKFVRVKEMNRSIVKVQFESALQGRSISFVKSDNVLAYVIHYRAAFTFVFILVSQQVLLYTRRRETPMDNGSTSECSTPFRTSTSSTNDTTLTSIGGYRIYARA